MAFKKNSSPKLVTAKAPANPGTPKPDANAEDFQRISDGRRIKDADSARTIYNRLVQDNALRSATFAQVRNQIEGGRPFDPKEKEENGEAWACNVNFGDSQASLNRVLQPFWKMVNDVPHRAAFTIDSSAPQVDQWQASYAEAFDEFHDDWAADYYQQFMQTVANYTKFGPGLVQWPNPNTPRYKAINPTRALFPKNAKMSPEEWELVCLVRDMPMTELYAYIRDKKTTERSVAAGWNENAIKATIVQAAGGGPPYDWRDYTRISDQLVNNDIMITTPFQPQTVAWLYVKQFDGTVGCYVFTPFGAATDFLYSDENCSDTFRQLIAGMWYDTGTDGMVHSIKGFGIKNFFFSSLINRMKSRMADSATFSLGINFQYADNNTPDETPPVENYGAYSVFPTGLTQLSVYPQLKAASDVMSILENNAAENNSLYRQNNEQIAESDTATQANILSQMQSQTAESSASIFLAQLGENFYTEQIRRLRTKGNTDPDAKAFVQRLKDKGVPDIAIFDLPLRVKTGANAGMWNPAARAQAFQEGLALASMPGVNTRWFLENFIAYKYGANAVDKALLPEGAESEPIQRRQAKMENVDFGQAAPLDAAPSDAHVEHIEEHLKPAAGIASAFHKNGNIPNDQAVALATTVEHTGQHMAFLQRDDTKKKEFQALLPQFRLIQSVTKGILAKMQKDQQQGGGGQPAQGGGGAPQGGGGGASARESISISYKDAPSSIQRQMEAAAGFQPATDAPQIMNGAQ